MAICALGLPESLAVKFPCEWDKSWRRTGRLIVQPPAGHTHHDSRPVAPSIPGFFGGALGA